MHVSDFSLYRIIVRSYPESFDSSKIYDFIYEVAERLKPLERDDGDVFTIFKEQS